MLAVCAPLDAHPQGAPAATPGGEAAPAAYRLKTADVIEVTVRGFPELRERAAIDLTGEVSIPLAGRVRVVGLSVEQAQKAIRELVLARPLRHRGADSRETFTVFSAEDVNVAIIEYRPVYVLGDVGKPGELPFRPGLTVRQAIALAGGYDIMRYRLVNPFIESAEFRSQHDTLWAESAKVRAQIARLRAELELKTSIDRRPFATMPIGGRYIEQVLDTESETLQRRIALYHREKDHIASLARQSEAKIETLEKQLRSEQEGLAADRQEFAELNALAKRGTVPMLRVIDSRRAEMASSSRVMQTQIQLDQAKRELSEARFNLQRFENARRTDLLRELQDATVAAGTVDAKLQAVQEKLQHTSLLKSRLVRGPGAKIGITVFRQRDGEAQAIPGDEDTALLPGDTIEIQLQSDVDVAADAAASSAR